MATRANLLVDQGATSEAVLTLTDEDGNILDLSSSNAASTLMEVVNSAVRDEP